MKKLIFIVFVTLSVLACQDVKRPEKPDNLIEKERFKDILYDVSLINAARDFSRGQLLNAGIKPDSFIFKKYEIDSLQLVQSINYYSVDFSEYQKIWEDISERIEQKRSEVDSLVRRQDSIETATRSNTGEEEERTGLMDPDEMKRNTQN